MFKLILTVLIANALTASAAELPKDLKWERNDKPTLLNTGKDVKQGGTFNSFISSFPLSLRNVGPDSNGSFRYFYDATNPGLTTRNPNTDEIIGILAEAWSFAKDNKTAYYKLRKEAKWSDGKPVTADDFVYVLDFMRSKHLVAPWYNQYYSEHYDKVIKFDDHTIAVVLHKANPELDVYSNLTPKPKHFYHPLGKDYVKKYNWKKQITAGPYVIDKVRKGKSIVVKKVKNWWAQDLPYFKNRFNVKRIVFTVVRDMNLAFEKFKKAEIDAFVMVRPNYWHDKSNSEEFKNGYINRIWFYTNKPESDMALEFNTAHEILKDKNVRLGISHAVNIEKVLATVLRGDYERQNTISSGHGKFTDSTIKARTYDLKKANEYFDKAGWTKRGPDGIRTKNGKRLTAKMSYSVKDHGPRLVVMKEELKKAGFDAELHLIDGALGFKHKLEKKHEIAYTGWGAMVRPQYYGRFHSDNANKTQTNNFTNWADPKLDKLIINYRQAATIEDKVKNSKAIQKAVHDAAITVPLWEVPYLRVGYWRWWQFPEPAYTKKTDVYMLDPLDLFSPQTGGLAWIDSKLKKEVKKARKKGKKYPVVNTKDTTYKRK